MARVSTIVTNFKSGELSPRLEGRIDLQKYNEAAQTIQNMVVFPSGGVTRRPGTYFAGRSKDGGKVRLINFEYSDEQAYVLEFGTNYIRFFKDGGILTEATTAITAITKANPAVVTAASHGLSNGDRVFIASVGGMTELNNREFTVANATSTTFELSGINSSSFTTYTSGGTVGKIVEVTTTYSATDIFEINHAQSADVLYLAHKDHEPAKLTRTTATSFTLTDIDFIDGPWLDENDTSTTMYASAATGSGITITASADTFSNDDIGRYIRFREVLEIEHDEWAASTSYANNATVRFGGHVYKQATGSTQTSGNTAPVHLEGTETYGSIDWEYLHDEHGHVRITGFTSATVVTADVHEDQFGNSRLPDSVVGSSNATKRWSLGAFDGDQGFPKAVAFYEQRLYFAGTTGRPQTIFGSKSADFENHTPGTEDDDAVNITIASDQVNVIRHLLPARFLQILTTSSEFTLSGGTGSTPVTPTNVNVLRETTFGTSDVRPVRAGNSTILIQKGQEKVKEITFNLDTDGLLGVDLSILADHIPRGGLTDMMWQQEPELILWFVHSDGRLIGLTYDRANNAIGWHDHSIGGSGVVESITAIPSGAEDQVYISVKRTIDGSTVRHIEYLKSIDFGTDVADAFFVDSGLTYSGSATTSITGLNHLEGETVSVLADGSTHGDVTVSGGAITLDRSASKVHIGYSYTSTIETLRMEAGAEDGISQGKIKRIHGVTVRFLDTVGAEVGPDTANLDRIPFRDSSMDMDTAVPMFSGDKEIFFPSGYDNDARVVVRQSQALPMTITAIMRRSNTFDA
tara:strand:- start:3943 stop:6354 length:2412 start_codon:yes stop_codon:yes gene_type:complete